MTIKQLTFTNSGFGLGAIKYTPALAIHSHFTFYTTITIKHVNPETHQLDTFSDVIKVIFVDFWLGSGFFGVCDNTGPITTYSHVISNYMHNRDHTRTLVGKRAKKVANTEKHTLKVCSSHF